MLNISNQSVVDEVWEHVPRQSRPELLRTFASQKLGRILMVIGIVFLIILFLPWRQTIEASARSPRLRRKTARKTCKTR